MNTFLADAVSSLIIHLGVPYAKTVPLDHESVLIECPDGREFEVHAPDGVVKTLYRTPEGLMEYAY